MGWIQGPMLKQNPIHHPDDPDEWYAVVLVTAEEAKVVGYSATNPLEVDEEHKHHAT